MKRNWKIALGGLVALVLGVVIFFSVAPRAQFVVGGALVNLGYRLQDPLEDFDFVHHGDITPEQVWTEVLADNQLASSVRTTWPRTPHHPLVASVVCMDARIDTNELLGDTRQYYYVIRTAGSALAEKEAEMLELAVQNGVKVLMLTTHSDCAAEKAAADAKSRERFPALVSAVDAREQWVKDFLARPEIASRVASGQLLVKRAHIDTANRKLAAR